MERKKGSGLAWVGLLPKRLGCEVLALWRVSDHQKHVLGAQYLNDESH